MLSLSLSSSSWTATIKSAQCSAANQPGQNIAINYGTSINLTLPNAKDSYFLRLVSIANFPPLQSLPALSLPPSLPLSNSNCDATRSLGRSTAWRACAQRCPKLQAIKIYEPPRQEASGQYQGEQGKERKSIHKILVPCHKAVSSRYHRSCASASASTLALTASSFLSPSSSPSSVLPATGSSARALAQNWLHFY